MSAIAELPSATSTAQASGRPGPQTRLHGRRLVLARAVWLALTLLAVSVLGAAIIVRLGSLGNFSIASVPPGWTMDGFRSALGSLGLSISFYLGFNLFFAYVIILGFLTTAFVIFLRRSDDWVALYVSLTLVLWPLSVLDFTNLLDKIPAFSLPLMFLSTAGTLLLVPFFFLFPNGRLVPRAGIWIIVGWILLVTSSAALPGSILDAASWPAILNFLMQASFVFAGAAAQIYRYKKASDITERQQTKWVVLNVTLMALVLVVYVLIKAIFPVVNQPSTAGLIYLLALPIVSVFFLLVPVGIGMSVLRYRLWDIDLIINRTLVYVPLTAILAGLFAASVALFQKLLLALSGQQSDLVAVLGTLIVVAALTPLKDRLQSLVDKRFKQDPESIRRLRTLSDQVHSRVNPVEPVQVVRRLFEEAVEAFGALSGAMYLESESGTQLVTSIGDWRGDVKLSVPLVTTNNGMRVGLITLGGRKSGATYTANEQRALEGAATEVAKAIAQDQLPVGIQPAAGMPA